MALKVTKIKVCWQSYNVQITTHSGCDLPSVMQKPLFINIIYNFIDKLSRSMHVLIIAFWLKYYINSDQYSFVLFCQSSRYSILRKHINLSTFYVHLSEEDNELHLLCHRLWACKRGIWKFRVDLINNGIYFSLSEHSWQSLSKKYFMRILWTNIIPFKIFVPCLTIYWSFLYKKWKSWSH